MPKQIKMDVYDKKIFYELLQDSRQSRKKLAKSMGISLQRLLYKIQRLEREIFLRPSVILNYPALEINSYAVLIPQADKENISKLLESPFLFFAMQAIGMYQFVLIVVTDDIQKFCEHHLPNTRLEIYPIVRLVPDNYNPFHITRKIQTKSPAEKVKLDKKDYLILHHISNKPLDSILDISLATSIDRKTIKSRINKMRKAFIIQKFRYGVNVFRLGNVMYFLKIDTSINLKNKVISHAHNDDFSGFIFETHTGLVMYYLPPSHNELFNFVQDVRTIDPNARIDVIQNTELFKVDTVPKTARDILSERKS